MFDNFNRNLRKNEWFLACIPCIPIPEYGQSNSPLKTKSDHWHDKYYLQTAVKTLSNYTLLRLKAFIPWIWGAKKATSEYKALHGWRMVLGVYKSRNAKEHPTSE